MVDGVSSMKLSVCCIVVVSVFNGGKSQCCTVGGASLVC